MSTPNKVLFVFVLIVVVGVVEDDVVGPKKLRPRKMKVPKTFKSKKVYIFFSSNKFWVKKNMG